MALSWHSCAGICQISHWSNHVCPQFKSTSQRLLIFYFHQCEYPHSTTVAFPLSLFKVRCEYQFLGAFIPLYIINSPFIWNSSFLNPIFSCPCWKTWGMWVNYRNFFWVFHCTPKTPHSPLLFCPLLTCFHFCVIQASNLFETSIYASSISLVLNLFFSLSYLIFILVSYYPIICSIWM